MEILSLHNIEVIQQDELVDYLDAVSFMEKRVADILDKEAKQLLWFVQHDHVYTAGTGTSEAELLQLPNISPNNMPLSSSSHQSNITPQKITLHRTGRGGKITYHGPGQLIVYIMLNILELHDGKPDVRLFIKQVENWLIDAMVTIGIVGKIIEQYPGVWVSTDSHVINTMDTCNRQTEGEVKPQVKSNVVNGSKKKSSIREAVHDRGNGYEKLAAIGIRIRRWISYHGVAINIEPDLKYFNEITPCGITEHGYGVTSMEKLGLYNRNMMKDLSGILLKSFVEIFLK